MNPSQEPAQPQHPRQPPADPTAEPPAPGAPAYLGPAVDGATAGFGTSAVPTDPAPGPEADSGYRLTHPSSPTYPGPDFGTAPDGGYGSAHPTGPAYPVPGPDLGTAPDGGYGSAHPTGPAYPVPGPELGTAPDGGYGLAHPTGPEISGEGNGPRWWDMQHSTRRPRKRTALVAILSAAVILALGGPLGLLWAWLAPSVPVIDAGKSGIVVNDPSPEEYIAADGWYTLLGLAFGLLVAIIAWLTLRRDRGPFLLLGVVAGALGAGYLIGPWVGEMIGRSAYDHWQDTATQGATYLAPPEVHSTGPMLVPAFAAAIVLTLLAGWSNDPDLEKPGAKPGYGPHTTPETWPQSPDGAVTPADIRQD